MISITNLSKYFGKFCAVNGLNLEVEKGELFCFLGPNGAGKTTTVKMLAGLMQPTSGVIKVGGYDMRSDALVAKQIMGYIPDMPYLYERLTAVEFMYFIGDLYRMERSVIVRKSNEYLQMFGLDDNRNQLIKSFSHGMRQRLIYAATFLHEPQVLLIDEPLIALDPYTIRLLKDTLKSRARAGTTILVTTHILSLAEDISDRIGIIDKASLIATGSYPELLKKHGGKDLEEVFLQITRS
ncbi:MAG: ABC transporter ATP-binding protein [Verrucomicrobiota bacterium]